MSDGFPLRGEPILLDWTEEKNIASELGIQLVFRSAGTEEHWHIRGEIAGCW